MGILDDLANQLSPKDQKTPAQRVPDVSAGLGTVKTVNADGTVNVIYNGSIFPVYTSNDFVPTIGSSILVLAVGTQLWGLGSGQPGSIGDTWGTVSNAVFKYAGDPNGIIASNTAGDLCVDTLTPALYQATSSGTHWEQIGGVVATTDMPIANPTGITTGTETPDPISGSGSAKWVEFPADQTVMAWGLAGDSFPRVVFGADPTDFGAILLGDGSFDPASGNGVMGIGTFPDVFRGHVMNIFGGADLGVPGYDFGAILGVLGFTGVILATPQGTVPGIAGDIVVCAAETGGPSGPSIWRCMTSGLAAGAVWALVSVIASTDPITATYTPPNAGALWQDTSGSGSLWISTGTSSGQWTQISPVPVPTTSFTSNAYTLALKDANTAQQSSNGSTAATVTIPTNASVAFPVGTVITFTQTGSGKIQLAAAGGVTVNCAGGFTSGTTGCRTQYSNVGLLKTATNTWTLSGDFL